MSETQNKINDGGSAFPIIDVNQPWNNAAKEHDAVQTDVVSSGMTMLDYFAAHASSEVVDYFVKQYLRVLATNEPETWGDNGLRYSEFHCKKIAMIEARYRYALAREMLAARAALSKGQP